MLVSSVALEKIMSTAKSAFKPIASNVSFSSVTTLMLSLTHIMGLSFPSLISIYIDDIVYSVTPYLANDFTQMPFLS